jgi:hypothetical protein
MRNPPDYKVATYSEGSKLKPNQQCIPNFPHFEGQTTYFQKEREIPPVPEYVAYYNLDDVRKDVKRGLDGGWNVVSDDPSELVLGIVQKHRLVLSCVISHDLTVEIGVMGIPSCEKKSLEKMKVRSFLKELSSLKVCEGVCDAELEKFVGCPEKNTSYFLNSNCIFESGNVVITRSVMSKQCSRLIRPSEDICNSCRCVKNVLIRKQRRKNRKDIVSMPHPKTPLSCMAKKSLKKALRLCRKNVNQLKVSLRKIKKQLGEDSLDICSNLHESLRSVMDETKMSPFVRVFWKEQQKAFKCASGGMRWHPMMIRFAIMLRSQSASAYRTIRETGVLKLPGECILRDYTNYVQPQTGFNHEILEDIRIQASKLSDEERWVVLMHDEMSIKSDLVFDQRSGNIVGYVDSQSWTFNQKEKTNYNLASHVLVYMIVGVCSNLKMTVAYFATSNPTAEDLYPFFWEAVGYLETFCGLKVNEL